MSVQKQKPQGKVARPSPKSSGVSSGEEIDQIMTEIEDLQEEMTAPAQPVQTGAKLKVVSSVISNEAEAEESVAEEDILREFHAGAGDDGGGLEETLADLGDAEPASPNSILDKAVEGSSESEDDTEYEAADEASAEASEGETMEDDMETGSEESGGGNDDGTMTMQLTGRMQLKLKYAMDGMEVTVGFSNNSLRVQLADGTEFKIPVNRKKLKRVA